MVTPPTRKRSAARPPTRNGSSITCSTRTPSRSAAPTTKFATAIQASLSREFRFFKQYVTTLTLTYTGRSGQPYSYVYANDLNTDGFTSNDLVAVPTGPTRLAV